MIVIATGPRSNGTSLLYRILCTGDTFPLHIPAYPPWFRGRDWAQDFPTALFVVIRREKGYAVRSLVERGLSSSTLDAAEEYDDALRYVLRLSWQLGPRALFIGYGDLVRDPIRSTAAITAFLRDNGYDGPALTLPEPVYDGNAKWQTVAA